MGSPRWHPRLALRAGALAVVVVGLLIRPWVIGPTRPGSVRAPATVRAPGGPRAHAETPNPTTAAVEFARAYAAFLYGRTVAADVQPESASLRRVLGAGRAAATPAERDRQVVVRDLKVDRRGAGEASATGLIDDGASPPYVLTFNLTLRPDGWQVDGVSGGGMR